MKNESILVVDSCKIEDMFRNKRKFYKNNLSEIIDIIYKEHYFMNRKLAEYDLSVKQIIPYAMISNESKYLLLRRTTKQSETRLHNKYSLGIGGHINPIDNTDNNILLKGLKRELSEEIKIEKHGDIILTGIINDDTSDVGKHHLGIFYTIESKSPKFEILEKDKMEGNWVTIEALLRIYTSLESWSQIIYNNYLAI